MILSEKLTLEQTNLLQARQKHHHDHLKLEEMAKIIFSEQQKVEDLTKEVSNMGHDTFTLQHSLNQELDASRRLKREGAVMEENFRRLEKENDQLRSLIGDEQKKITFMQDALNEQLKARSHLETEYEKAKIEKESCQLMRDTLRYVEKLVQYAHNDATFVELRWRQKTCSRCLRLLDERFRCKRRRRSGCRGIHRGSSSGL